MLKVCTSYSKKVPAWEEYSSQQYHASVEVELSDGLKPEDIQQRIHDTFNMVRSCVEEEIGGHTTSSRQTPHRSNNGNGHGRNGDDEKASNKQIKYALDLANEHGIKLGQLNTFIEETYGVNTVYSLSKKDASNLVDMLRRGRVQIPA